MATWAWTVSALKARTRAEQARNTLGRERKQAARVREGHVRASRESGPKVHWPEGKRAGPVERRRGLVFFSFYFLPFSLSISLLSI